MKYFDPSFLSIILLLSILLTLLGIFFVFNHLNKPLFYLPIEKHISGENNLNSFHFTENGRVTIYLLTYNSKKESEISEIYNKLFKVDRKIRTETVKTKKEKNLAFKGRVIEANSGIGAEIEKSYELIEKTDEEILEIILNKLIVNNDLKIIGEDGFVLNSTKRQIFQDFFALLISITAQGGETNNKAEQIEKIVLQQKVEILNSFINSIQNWENNFFLSGNFLVFFDEETHHYSLELTPGETPLSLSDLEVSASLSRDFLIKYKEGIYVDTFNKWVKKKEKVALKIFGLKSNKIQPSKNLIEIIPIAIFK